MEWGGIGKVSPKKKELSEYLLCAKFSSHKNKQDKVPPVLELTF